MRDLQNKTAVVTGGASGVGRCLGILLAREGANVVLVDINQNALDKTIAELHGQGLDNIAGRQADVTSPESMQALADWCFTQYANVHVLCNNAGVGVAEASRPLWTLPPKDWEWGFAVNTLGAVNGIRAFVPRMIANGEEGNVINTSSGNGGVTSLSTTPIYASSKAALTSLTEVLHFQLLRAESKIKAAVMFPGPHLVNTKILDSSEARPERFMADEPSPQARYKTLEELAANSGIEFAVTEPEEVAEYTLAGIKNDDFWIFPPDSSSQFEKLKARTEQILRRENPALPD